MTPEDHRLLKLWQERRDRGVPPELRLLESREDFSRLHDNTMSMFRVTVSERSNIERVFHGREA